MAQECETNQQLEPRLEGSSTLKDAQWPKPNLGQPSTIVCKNLRVDDKRILKASSAWLVKTQIDGWRVQLNVASSRNVLDRCSSSWSSSWGGQPPFNSVSWAQNQLIDYESSIFNNCWNQSNWLVSFMVHQQIDC